MSVSHFIISIGFLGMGLTVLALELASRRWLALQGEKGVGPIAFKDPLSGFYAIGEFRSGIWRFTLPEILYASVSMLVLGRYCVGTLKDTDAAIGLLRMSPLGIAITGTSLLAAMVCIIVIQRDEVRRLRSAGVHVMKDWLWRGVWWGMLAAFDKADRKQKQLMCYGYLLPIAAAAGLALLCLVLLVAQEHPPFFVRPLVRLMDEYWLSR